jgi:hypothetical protein
MRTARREGASRDALADAETRATPIATEVLTGTGVLTEKELIGVRTCWLVSRLRLGTVKHMKAVTHTYSGLYCYRGCNPKTTAQWLADDDGAVKTDMYGSITCVRRTERSMLCDEQTTPPGIYPA